MALGNKKSDSSGPGAGSTPPPPPPFAESTPPDGLITSLDERLQQLQATVTALVERTSGSAAGPAPADPEMVAASRTLKMAEQTADATVTEARDEASKLLAGARDQHDAMLVAARQAAEAEFAAQREAVATEAAAWELKKRDLLEMFVKIEAQLTECDGRLAEAHRLVRNAIDQPHLAPVSDVKPAGAAPEPAPVVVPEPATAVVPEPAAVSEPTAPSTEAPAAPVVDPPSFASLRVEPEPAANVAAAEPVENEAAPKETVFGNPPAPVFTGPASEPTGTQAFYPWSGNTAPSSSDDDEAADASSSESPAPPVQRRGLFGH
jgi:vacuolar-type H+-ATPase subunit H